MTDLGIRGLQSIAVVPAGVDVIRFSRLEVAVELFVAFVEVSLGVTNSVLGFSEVVTTLLVERVPSVDVFDVSLGVTILVGVSEVVTTLLVERVLFVRGVVVFSN